MPELPEVETVRRGLEPVLLGARIDKVLLRRADIRFPLPPRFAERLQGRRIVALERRAKYLLFKLDSSETLLAHLGMSGSFRVEPPEISARQAFHFERSKDPKHDHVVISLDSGAVVIYNDPRRFGFMDLAPSEALGAHPRLADLGDEPLAAEFDAARLASLLSGSRTSLKAALLDQTRIAGLGNIYVCEALFRAGLAPTRRSGALVGRNGRPNRMATALATSIRMVLEEAIGAGGSTLRDHRQADGALGYFQHTFAVYDREGYACPRRRCNGTISRIVQSGRSTFYCPICQK